MALLLEASAAVVTATAPQASSALPSLALEVLAREGISLWEVGALAVACGPGSFTGIKIGLASAWGLARPSRARLFGVPSLDALAVAGRRAVQAAGPADLAGPWVAVCGAYAGLVYAARFRAGAVAEEVELDGAYTVGKPAEVMPALLAGGARVALEGTSLAEVAAGALEGFEVVRIVPGGVFAEALVRLARHREAKGLRQESRALYLRADPAKAW